MPLYAVLRFEKKNFHPPSKILRWPLRNFRARSFHFIRRSAPRPPRGARAKPEYCICRGFDDGSKMIVFDGCDEWFQANCLDILEDYIATLESESLKWYCPGCSLNANSNYVA